MSGALWRRSRGLWLLSLAALTLVYFVAGKLGLTLAFVNTSATAVWPPTGIAIAALLLLGRDLWPAVFVGAFAVNVTTTSDVGSSVGIAVGNTLEAIIAAGLVARFANGARAFERPQDVFKFAFLGGVLATNVSATIGPASLALFNRAEWSDFGPIWFTWWLGDLGGALIVAPALLAWATMRQGLRDQWLERGLLAVSTVVAGVLLFGGGSGISLNRDPVAFLTFPPLIWAAYRFGPRESISACLVLAAIADWGTLRGWGPFASSDSNRSLLLLQGFMAVASVTANALAAAVLDRRRSANAVRSVERRLREIAEESARLREEFLSIATHELRTPVTSARGFAQLAQRALAAGDRAGLEHALETIVRQTDALSRLIAQLLVASDTRTDMLRVTPQPRDLSRLVADTVATSRGTDHQHEWRLDIEDRLWAHVDPVRFEEVVLNLLDNATKFSPPGSTIDVRLRPEGDEVCLTVRDEGPGIAPERIGHVFERFYRGHDDPGTAGLGLGLYIAREIVERHGGRIEVSSSDGRGSTFAVRLPQIAPQAAPTTAPAEPRMATRATVLVVEDDDDIRRLVIDLLEGAGHSAVGARDGEEALALAESKRPDLVILDKLMPVLDGTEFARRYRAGGHGAPIVAMCAARDAETWAAAIDAVACVAKPFSVDELERVVDRELSRRQAAVG